MFRLLSSVFLLATFGLPAVADLAPLQVQGPSLVANGKPVTLRGLDWGWWHLKGTKYTEDDMKQQAAWGTNVVRLVFTYSDIEDPAHPGQIREDGFQQFDQVIQWAKACNQYVILDMHVAPGGQDPAPYCDGGFNKIWHDTPSQDRFVALWTELARRYKDRPEVGAYELMNEPCTQTASNDRLVALCKRAIAAIRTVDPAKVIVMPADQWDNARFMIDDIKMDDPNILYTFHFYGGLPPVQWMSNDKEGPGIKGTQDWTELTVPLTVPAGASSLSVMLRSTKNSGTAWFDDLTLTDDYGNTVQSESFDNGPKPFRSERKPDTGIEFDPAVGHNGPGSLRVSGTDTYNGWSGPRLPVRSGRTYNLAVWVKLDGATGDTYASAAYFGIKSATADADAIRGGVAPAAAFAKKFNVPVWVGEFGCEGDEVPAGLQNSWVSKCIQVFEEDGFSWTYWNYKETTGPGSMALEPEKGDGTNYPIDQELLSALQTGWAKNAPPV